MGEPCPAVPIAERRKAGTPVWRFTYPEFARAFSQACQLYSTRLDIPQLRQPARNVQSLAENKERGEWKADKSVSRYDKAARLTHILELHKEELRNYTLQCENALTRPVS